MASSISQGRPSKKITRPVIVGLQLLIVNLHVVQDETYKKTLTEEQEIISRKSSNWLQEDQFLKILKDLKPALTSRVNCSQPGTSKINYQSKDLKSITDLKVSYNFKKRPNIPGQHFVLQKAKNVHCLCGKKVMKKYVNYSSYPIFHETLEIKVKKCNTFETECLHSRTTEKPVDEMKGDGVTDTATSSYYFSKETDRVHTSSVKRKKTTLRKIAKKSRTALVELPSYQKISEAESENEEEIEETYSGRSPTIPTGRRTKKRRQTAVIDLEKEPEGLNDVSKVEDLRRDHLKFLINQMEDYLRNIFRGEVYCRRHEDYKKGGKLRDDLNFQVGMAHFSEEQHECILNSLGAMFCYRNKKYLDYVMKVMLPEALIKLYQDIHKTSFQEGWPRPCIDMMPKATSNLSGFFSTSHRPNRSLAS